MEDYFPDSIRGGAQLGAARIVDHEPPALDEFGNRLRGMVEMSQQARVNLRDFFGRCGFGSPEKGDERDPAVHQTGHIHDINHGLDDLERLVRDLVDLTGSLRRIG